MDKDIETTYWDKKFMKDCLIVAESDLATKNMNDIKWKKKEFAYKWAKGEVTWEDENNPFEPNTI